MTDDRKGGFALILGSMGMLVTMILHPSGGDFFVAGQLGRMTHLGVAAHALGLVSQPILFLGTLALSQRVASGDRLALAALVTFAFGIVAVMSAAVVGGLVAPTLAGEILAASPPADQGWRIVFHYTGLLNRAFATVFVVASSAAIVLWSAGIVRSRALAPGVGVYGLLLGPAIVIAVASGHLRLDVHGFGLVVLGQAAWFIIVGTLLWRLKRG